MSKQVPWWSKLVSCMANDYVIGRSLGLAQNLAGLASVSKISSSDGIECCLFHLLSGAS